MFALRDILVTLIVIGSIPFTFKRPHIGILMWSWVAYMVPHSLGWGFARSMPIAMIVGGATILAWLASKEPKRLPMHTVTVLMLALMFWISLTTLFAIAPDDAYPDWDTAIKVMAMNLLTIILISSRQRIEAVVWVIVCCIALYAVKGGIYMVTGGVGRVYGPPGGFFEENNALGLTILTIIPLMWYLQTRVPKPIYRWAFRAAMALSLIAVIGTYSRGAAIAGVAMLLFLVVRSRQRAFLVIALAFGITIGIPFIPERWVSRVESIQSYEEDGSAMGRIEAWTFAIKLALDRPLVGGGFRVNAAKELYLSYVPEATKPRVFHSVYFQMLGEHGFVGLAIFLSLAAAAFRCGSATIRRTKGKAELLWANDLARMLQVSLVGFMVGGMFLNLAFFDLLHNLFALLLVVHLEVAKALAPSQAGAGEQENETRIPPYRTPSRADLAQAGQKDSGNGSSAPPGPQGRGQPSSSPARTWRGSSTSRADPWPYAPSPPKRS